MLVQFLDGNCIAFRLAHPLPHAETVKKKKPKKKKKKKKQKQNRQAEGNIISHISKKPRKGY